MEDIINQIDGQVQIIFEKSFNTQTFRDALWMTQAEYDTTPVADIEAMKQQRFDNWLAIVNPQTTDIIDTPEV